MLSSRRGGFCCQSQKEVLAASALLWEGWRGKVGGRATRGPLRRAEGSNTEWDNPAPHSIPTRSQHPTASPCSQTAACLNTRWQFPCFSALFGCGVATSERFTSRQTRSWNGSFLTSKPVKSKTIGLTGQPHSSMHNHLRRR